LFPCTEDGPCGTGGVCVAPGYCAFADSSCASGQRFGELAPSELEGTCVTAGDAGVADAAPAQVMSFGEAVTDDNWIDSENPTRNHGTAQTIRADHDPQRYGLLRFDLGALPAGTVIASADLHVWTATTDGGFDNGGVIRLYRLTEAWDEGTVADAAGTANWTQRQPSTNWGGPGATGISRDPQVVAEIPATANDREYVIAIPVALVQGWVDAPQTNFGWVLVAEDAMTDSANLVSSEGATASKRPRLVVSYR
jgi:hypothetical protein